MKNNIFYLAFLVTLSIACSGKEPVKRGVKFDYLIRNGMVVDGMGNPWHRADIGIIGDKIARIGHLPQEQGKSIIDASGKVVAPGFIDIHSHGEARILEDPTAHNFITQGVTTIVGGNCGGSPLNLREFFGKVDSAGIALNLGVLAGHNSVRKEVMGNAGREPTGEELEEMKKIVEEEMQAGALGLSTGLKYQPGVYSKTAELIELAKVASKYGGFYASHLRDEGLKLFESMQEALEIGEKAGIPVQMSHHKAVGMNMWGKTETSLKMIEDARKRGLDVTADQYPYSSTFTGITIIFPAWALEGTKSEIQKRLDDPETRKRVKEGIIYNIKYDRGGNDIRTVTIAEYSKDTALEGKNLAEILLLKGKELSMENAAELVLEIYENGGASAIYHCLSEEDLVRVMKNPLVMHASDADNAEYNKGKIHPRHYGCFPRVLALYVRERGELRLEEAIRKMTSFPASRIGAQDRGIISEDKYADIVIFDPETVQDKATWDNPHQYPEGLDYVFVNGEIVVDHGKITGKLPGKIIYGPGKEK
ncbi:MAG TPA: D-aminoacylase [archaeon]|nr:D-aminoacylase [archaeon]